MDDHCITFDTGAATHVGKVRKRNEDSYLVHPDMGLWAVADGMGGHNDGDLASQTVIDALRMIGPAASAAELLTLCENSIADAHMRLRSLARERGGAIGATLALLLVYDGFYACVWSGDSRIYIVREGTISQISRDHSEVQELVSGGVITAEEAKKWPGRNAITRAIGVFDEPELEMRSGPLQPADAFVVCSDGLPRHVEDSEIMHFVNSHSPQSACDGLISLTLERDAVDNVSVVIVRGQPALWKSPEPASPRHEMPQR